MLVGLLGAFLGLLLDILQLPFSSNGLDGDERIRKEVEKPANELMTRALNRLHSVRRPNPDVRNSTSYDPEPFWIYPDNAALDAEYEGMQRELNFQSVLENLLRLHQEIVGQFRYGEFEHGFEREVKSHIAHALNDFQSRRLHLWDRA